MLHIEYYLLEVEYCFLSSIQQQNVTLLLVANNVSKANCSTATTANGIEGTMCFGMPNIRRAIVMTAFISAVAIKIIETRKSLDVDDLAQHCFVVRKYSTRIIATSNNCINSQIK